MFNRIAGNYDFLNHLLSFSIDKKWRKLLCAEVESFRQSFQHSKSPIQILDVATGTGDVAFMLNKLGNCEITGLDLSEEMIKQARKKSLNRGVEMDFITGDSENLPFEQNRFDCLTVAFGVRNFEDLNAGLNEFSRVLKKGGLVCILEFSKPEKGVFGSLYMFYSKRILPLIASLFSREPRAYQYLPESIYAFPHGQQMLELMQDAGFYSCSQKRLSKGIASLYMGYASE